MERAAWAKPDLNKGPKKQAKRQAREHNLSKRREPPNQRGASRRPTCLVNPNAQGSFVGRSGCEGLRAQTNPNIGAPPSSCLDGKLDGFNAPVRFELSRRSRSFENHHWALLTSWTEAGDVELYLAPASGSKVRKSDAASSPTPTVVAFAVVESLDEWRTPKRIADRYDKRPADLIAKAYGNGRG